jgi:predicted ester cyclase
MATRTPEETVKAYLHVGGHDPEACREFLAADFACVSELRPSFNADVFLARMELYRKSIPDIKLELGSWIISQGDTVVCEALESGTFTEAEGWAATMGIEPTGRSYRIPTVLIFRFNEDGLIREYGTVCDRLLWLIQMGVDPSAAIRPVKAEGTGSPQSASD